jgi:hypothetical protein
MKRVKVILLCSIFLISLFAFSISALAQFDFSGIINLSGADGVIHGSGSWGQTSPILNPETTLSWNVMWDHAGLGLVHYEYTFTHPAYDVSYFILEIPDTFCLLNNMRNISITSYGNDIIESIYIDDYLNNQNMPGTIHGVKFNLRQSYNQEDYNEIIISFDSNRLPQWGDFYAIGIHGLNTAWNRGFVTSEPNFPEPLQDIAQSGSINHHILIPGDDTIDGSVNIPDIDVLPLTYDFGDIEEGSSSTAIVTVSNVGCAALTVNDIIFPTGSSSDFSITSVPTTPVVIPPEGTADIEITYTPSVIGITSTVLNIISDDPDEGLVEVELSGTGVEVELPPLEQIQNMLDFFDASVSEGTLVGHGPGRSAEGRRYALRNMIIAAGDLIREGATENACEQLLDIYNRMDGLPKPPDFVSGEAASTLADMILDLRTDMGC